MPTPADVGAGAAPVGGDAFPQLLTLPAHCQQELIASSRNRQKAGALCQTKPAKITRSFSNPPCLQQQLLSPEGKWLLFLLALLSFVLIIFQLKFSFPKPPNGFLRRCSHFSTFLSVADLFSHYFAN